MTVPGAVLALVTGTFATVPSAAPAAAVGLEAAVPGAMPVGGYTSQPIGHHEFCKVYAGECARQARSLGPVTLTRASWTRILSVNAEVNATVVPMSDQEVYGREEVWTFPDGVGDCEDYVLLKRQMLMNAGLPESALLITVVRKPDGEGHAVLTVRTDRGDLVLDNLIDDVRLWADTPYTFLKRQSQRFTGRWVAIVPTDQTVVGAVR